MTSYLAREDVPKGTESVVESFVVNRLVQILYKDVANPRTTKRGITLGPHDTTRLSFDGLIVHSIQCSLG